MIPLCDMQIRKREAQQMQVARHPGLPVSLSAGRQSPNSIKMLESHGKSTKMLIISVMMLCRLSPNTRMLGLMTLSPNMAIPILDWTNSILTPKPELCHKSVGLWDPRNLASMSHIFHAMGHGYRRKLSIRWFMELPTTARWS